MCQRHKRLVHNSEMRGHKVLLCAALNRDMCLLFAPFPLAERSTSCRDEAAVILVLLSVVLQQGVLVPVQVVHQVAIATILRHQIQRA